MRVRYTEQGSADYDRLLEDTARDWPASLQRTAARLDRFEQTVVSLPLSGQETRHPGIRRFSLAPLPFIAFYRVTADAVEILRLYHTSKRPYHPGRA